VVLAAVPRGSFERLPKERRTRILAVAAEEFAKFGFHAASYNRLLTRAGLGKSSAYHYFEDKADLFLTVVSDRYRAFFESVDSSFEPSTPEDYWAIVNQVNLRGMQFMLSDPTSTALMRCLTREGSSPPLTLYSERVLSTVDGYYRQFLKIGQRIGAVRSDLPFELLSRLARGLSATLDQAFLDQVDLDSVTSSRRLQRTAAQWTDLLRRVFEPERPAAGGRPKPAAKRKPKSRVRASAKATSKERPEKARSYP
jgi:AcrR family transcriptional regulator